MYGPASAPEDFERRLDFPLDIPAPTGTLPADPMVRAPGRTPRSPPVAGRPRGAVHRRGRSFDSFSAVGYIPGLAIVGDFAGWRRATAAGSGVVGVVKRLVHNGLRSVSSPVASGLDG
jgi:hypothetical protein